MGSLMLMSFMAPIWAKAGAASAELKARVMKPASASLDGVRMIIGGFLVATVL
jgi:hypothetical protein